MSSCFKIECWILVERRSDDLMMILNFRKKLKFDRFRLLGTLLKIYILGKQVEIKRCPSKNVKPEKCLKLSLRKW